MSRSKLAAATAALTLTLAACATEGSENTTDDTDDTAQTQTEGDDAGSTGDLTGTISDAQTNEDGSVDLTVETDDGTEELTTSTAAYITTTSEGGGQQRTRLSNWLENNEFDDSTEYAFDEFGGVVTDVRG
jgi:hypothetical protein